MRLEVIPYSPEWENKWDKFVLDESVNGTFLQTRNFLNYHPVSRFVDDSLLVMKGSDIVAVIPACSSKEPDGNYFFSHKGSTFGGIVVAKKRYNISTLEELFPLVEEYIKTKDYDYIFIRNTSDIFATESMDLLDYFYYKNGFTVLNEISFYIDCKKISEDIFSTWSSGRRRDYRYSLKNDLRFRKIQDDEQLKVFHNILTRNLSRHGAKPVHSFTDLVRLRDVNLKDIVDYYGAYLGEKMIAGSMVFKFGHDVLHTQYLAQDFEYSHMFPMNFLNYNLIRLAYSGGYRKFSFGISTEDKGKTLNIGLAVFKEGFGTQYCNNRTYSKRIR